MNSQRWIADFFILSACGGRQAPVNEPNPDAQPNIDLDSIDCFENDSGG